MSQFKTGDLALIVNSSNEENIGRVVTVSGFANKGDGVSHGDVGFVMAGSDGWIIVDGEIVVNRIGLPSLKFTVSRHIFLRSYLMPLRGDFSPEQQKSREVSA